MHRTVPRLKIFSCETHSQNGSVALYLKTGLTLIPRPDLSKDSTDFEVIWVEVENKSLLCSSSDLSTVMRQPVFLNNLKIKCSLDFYSSHASPTHPFCHQHPPILDNNFAMAFV